MSYYRPRKARVEQCGYILPSQFGPGDRHSFACKGKEYEVHFATAHVGYGDRRYFLCPRCGERRTKLYLYKGQFACVRCHDLQYTSSQIQGNRYTEIELKAVKVGQKLGFRPEPPHFHHKADKPRGMHWETYTRLYEQLVWLSGEWARVWMDDVARSGMLRR